MIWEAGSEIGQLPASIETLDATGEFDLFKGKERNKNLIRLWWIWIVDRSDWYLDLVWDVCSLAPCCVINLFSDVQSA